MALTVAEVLDQVASVASVSGDEEIAHGMEDALFVRVLQAIAAGDPDAPALADAALTSRKIVFNRWHA